MTKEALNIALKALERVNTSPHLEDWHHAFDEEITAIKEVLAQPQEKYQYGTPLLDAFTKEQK